MNSSESKPQVPDEVEEAGDVEGGGEARASSAGATPEGGNPGNTPETESAEAPDSAGQEEDAGDESPGVEQSEARKWRDVAMRTAADLENFRKRASREREESMRYANQSLLEELLPVMDNFEMGMQAASQEKDSMVYVGMDMVRRQLNEFLSGHGVTEIKVEGEPFDPNLHDAVSEEETEEVEPGRVVRVTRRGFMLKDRLLRPASVVVAKRPESGQDTE